MKKRVLKIGELLVFLRNSEISEFDLGDPNGCPLIAYLWATYPKIKHRVSGYYAIAGDGDKMFDSVDVVYGDFCRKQEELGQPVMRREDIIKGLEAADREREESAIDVLVTTRSLTRFSGE